MPLWATEKEGWFVWIFPCGTSLQRAQPLVFGWEGELYLKTRSRHGAATLVTASAVAHPLRRLCVFRDLIEHLIRLNARRGRQLLEMELARRSAANCTDPLRYVVDHLAPSFCERDWNEAYQEDVGTESGRAVQVDLSVEMAAVTEAIPAPTFSVPSLWLYGRVWALRPRTVVPTAMYVRLGDGEALGLTGEYTLASAVESQWRTTVETFVAAAAARLAARERPGEVSLALHSAREAIARNGYWQCGDLLFLPGNPPRLGYVLPTHHNRVLGCQSDHDLAMTSALHMPPSISLLSAFRRSAAGEWLPFHAPHGLCFGSGPPTVSPVSPGLALAAYLRWAALRIAANGKFHALDG
jgi:hypothetical protein